jgi:uncharacterized protein
MDERLTIGSPSGDALAAIISAPQKPNNKGIILLHCFTCTKHHRIIRSLSECLTKSGFTVLRFDFGGNGESTGKLEDATYTRMLGEIRAAVTHMRRMGIRQIGIAGHSMGAMLSLLAAHEDRRIKAVGFIAGSSQAARVREIFPAEAVRKAEEQGSAEALVYNRKMALRREFLLDVEKYNVGHTAAVLKRPLLIVHGSADEVIPPFHARQVYNWASGPREMHIIEGADHLFRKDADLARLSRDVCAWFEKHL